MTCNIGRLRGKFFVDRETDHTSDGLNMFSLVMVLKNPYESLIWDRFSSEDTRLMDAMPTSLLAIPLPFTRA
jgi:hypothetical protein